MLVQAKISKEAKDARASMCKVCVCFFHTDHFNNLAKMEAINCVKTKLANKNKPNLWMKSELKCERYSN